MEHSMGRRQPVRVLLVDDSILTLHGLKTFLSKSSHIDIVGVAKIEPRLWPQSRLIDRTWWYWRYEWDKRAESTCAELSVSHV